MKSKNGDVLSFTSINAARQQFRVRFTTISQNFYENNLILNIGKKMVYILWREVN